MKRKLGAWVGLALLAVAAAARPARAGDQDFVLVNKTGVEIYALHVSPSGEDEWGDDILGQETLGDGEQAKIEFSPTAEAKYWDLRIEDEDGNAIEWKKLNLLQISKLTLFYDAETGKASARAD